jgi:hypothetical protein
MTTPKLFTLALIFLTIALGASSCSKADLGEGENTFSGEVDVTSTGPNPAGDFTGTGDSGVYSFFYENSSKKADVRFDITSQTGSVQLMVQDKRGETVLDELILGGADNDTFSGETEEGKAGIWKVTLTLTNFNGDGSYSINPA